MQIFEGIGKNVGKLQNHKKQAKKLEKPLLQKTPELKQVEEVWERLKADDWESIHFDIIKGTNSFRKK